MARSWFKRRWAFAVAAVVVICAGIAIARQAEVTAGLDSMLQPDFVRRDLVVLQNDLRLDAAQASILEMLFSDYEEAFQRGVDEMNQQMAQLRPAMGAVDPEIEQRREQIRDRAAALVEETQRLREEMMNQIEGDEANAEELRRAFEAKAAELQQEFQKLQGKPLTPANIQQALSDSAARIEAWQAQKSHLRDEFINNVRATLTRDQDERWPALERKFTRDKTLAQGRLSGESVDLHHVLRELTLNAFERDTLDSILNDYEMRLDVALRQRQQYFTSSQRRLIEAIQNEDARVGEALIDRQIQLRLAVRDVNDEFAAILASSLPEEAGDRLVEHYRARAYSRVYRITQTQRLFNAAKETHGLKSDELDAIEALRRAYLTELTAVNEQILRVLRHHEPLELKQQLMRRWDRGPDSAASPVVLDPIRDEFATRESLNHRYTRQLMAILGPERFGRLPGSAAHVDGEAPQRP